MLRLQCGLRVLSEEASQAGSFWLGTAVHTFSRSCVVCTSLKGYIRYPTGASCFTSLEDMDESELRHEVRIGALASAFARLRVCVSRCFLPRTLDRGCGGTDAQEELRVAAAATEAALAGADAVPVPSEDAEAKKEKKQKKKKKKKKGSKRRKDHENLPLIPLDDKVRTKLDKIADMVIFRYVEWGGFSCLAPSYVNGIVVPVAKGGVGQVFGMQSKLRVICGSLWLRILSLQWSALRRDLKARYACTVSRTVFAQAGFGA